MRLSDIINVHCHINKKISTWNILTSDKHIKNLTFKCEETNIFLSLYLYMKDLFFFSIFNHMDWVAKGGGTWGSYHPRRYKTTNSLIIK